MKRALQLVFAISFIVIFLVSPVTAATSQGLEWGVAQNDEFTLQFTIVDEGVTTLDESVNFTIGTELSIIDDPVTTWNFPPPSIGMIFANGTYVPPFLIYIMEIDVIDTVGQFVVPIGNFTLLSELLQATSLWTEDSTIVNDETRWGVHVATGDSEQSTAIDVLYLKADGFLSRYELQVTNTTSGVSSGVTLTRDGSGLDIVGILTDNIFFVGIGVGVLLVLVVVCMRRK